MKTFLLFLTFVISCLAASGQDTTPQDPAVTAALHQHWPDDLKALVDPKASAPAALIFSSVAVGATDWQFTGPVSGRQYSVSAKQQVAITGAILGVALMVRHLWPKTTKYVDAGLYLGAAGFAGKAYANTQGH